MLKLTDMINAFEESKKAINKVLRNNPVKSFKIGKTSQPLEARFAQSYDEDYDSIHQVYLTHNTELIDWLEKELIKYYKENDPDRCDNQQVGGGPDEEDIALVGMIYLVVKN